MQSLIRFDLLFPYAIPPILTLAASIFVVSLTIHAGRHVRENQIFTLFCLGQSLYSVDLILRTLITDPVIMLTITRLQHFSFVFLIPLGIHLAHALLKIHHRNWLIYLAYGYSLVMLPLSQTRWYITETKLYFFGFFTHSGPLLTIYAIVALPAALYVSVLLINAARTEADLQRRIKFRFISIGLICNSVLLILNVLPVLGLPVYPPSNFGFIPLSLMAYGILQHQIFDTAKSWFYKGYIPRTLVVLIWTPLLGIVLFWL
ncbi:MAG: hypothetical protein HQM12_05485 [SAR324 cluster bacterium]|nr:hypothetical protein [SAR324 cluster bacterium]